VLDVGEVEPLGPYIVMEYLEGKSLAELLDARLFDRQGPMTPERVVEYLLQACEALAAAHAIGVIHRDVKPDNLFVTRHGGLETLKLLDFGISKAALTELLPGADVATSTTSFVLGTPLYMSPEQLRSLPDVDCRTDVWSMGAVMYELLSGRPPFHAASIPEICAAILDATPAPLPVSCPEALQAVVMRCLEKDRARRFQSMAELAAALVPHAPGDARAYASRASSILRASTLNLDVAREAGVSEAASAARSASHPFRFQSSALVAAATVLALSALGVAIALTKMRGPDSSAPGVRPTAASSEAPAVVTPAVVTPAAVTTSAVAPAVVAPAVLTPGMTPPAAVTVPAVTASSPAAPSLEPVARILTPIPAVSPAAPLERHARALVAPKGKATRAASRSSAAASAGGEALEFEAAGDDPERTESIGRVRLVKARPRLRLVERVEPRVRPALLSVDRAAARKPASASGTGDVQ
jgi:serine/threonine-protein kinase